MTGSYRGVGVKTTVEIEWYTLGQHLSSLNSYDQAAFLEGFSAGLFDLGAVNALNQVAYIAEACHGQTKWLVDELSEALA